MGLEKTVLDEFNSTEQHPSKLKTTIHNLEEQIQILIVKIEDIDNRLNNITSILQDTHIENLNFFKTSSDIINFNARLIIVENELSILRKKSSQNHVQSKIPQGILIG